jgi:glycosyltransferase involved in cell wall biosynthesis
LDILHQLGLTPRRYLLVVSRLVPHKGIHTIITAFRTLKRECREFYDLRLAIVGSPAFTDAYADELAILAGGDPAILFLGRRTGGVLDVLYQHALAFVHASTSEGLPIAVLEAAAAGAIPVVSDIPEHREVIERTGGFLFRTGDAWDCMTKLEVAIRGAAGSARVRSAVQVAAIRWFDWERAALRTGERYAARSSQ